MTSFSNIQVAFVLSYLCIQKRQNEQFHECPDVKSSPKIGGMIPDAPCKGISFCFQTLAILTSMDPQNHGFGRGIFFQIWGVFGVHVSFQECIWLLVQGEANLSTSPPISTTAGMAGI